MLKLIKLNNETRRYESYDVMTFAYDQDTGHGFSHTNKTLACFGNLGKSLGIHTKFLAAECGDTTSAGTVGQGVRGPVVELPPISREEPVEFAFRRWTLDCLPRQDFEIQSYDHVLYPNLA